MRLPGSQRKPLVARRTASTRPDGILLLQLVGMDAVKFEAIMCNEVTIVDDFGRVDFQILRRRWSSHNMARAILERLSPDATKPRNGGKYILLKLKHFDEEHEVEALRAEREKSMADPLISSEGLSIFENLDDGANFSG